MLLLFVLGVMNLVWIAVLAAFVFADKVLPNVRWISGMAGLAFVVWGVVLVIGNVGG